MQYISLIEPLKVIFGLVSIRYKLNSELVLSFSNSTWTNTARWFTNYFLLSWLCKLLFARKLRVKVRSQYQNIRKKCSKNWSNFSLNFQYGGPSQRNLSFQSTFFTQVTNKVTWWNKIFTPRCSCDSRWGRDPVHHHLRLRRLLHQANLCLHWQWTQTGVQPWLRKPSWHWQRKGTAVEVLLHTLRGDEVTSSKEMSFPTC